MTRAALSMKVPPSAMPLVSVITPAYNAERFIADTVASVRAQTLADIEMLIADDGSTDDTIATAEAAAQGDPRIRILRGAHVGRPSIQRNRAYAQARGRWIALLDADDHWEPTRLERQLDAQLRARSRWGFGNVRIVGDDPRRPSGLRYAPTYRPSRPIFPELFIGECVPSPTIIARRDLLDQLTDGDPRAFMDESLTATEDWDLTTRLALHDEPAYLPEPLATYRDHASGLSKRGETSHQYCLAFYEKYRRMDVDPRLLQRALRRTRSKLATHRMHHGGGPWRAMLAASCLARPRDARDLFLGALAFLPAPLARRAYAYGIARSRSG